MGKGMITRRRLAAAVAGAGTLLSLGGLAPARAAPAAASEYLFLVYSDPAPGQEAAYDRWFASRRFAPMAAVPGVVSVQHFVDPKLELRHAAVATPHDLTLYTVESARPEASAKAIARLAAAGDAWPGPSVAVVHTATYRVFRPAATGAGGEPPGAKAGAPADYAVLALHNVIEGQDDAFNTWYDTVHMPELMAHPGVTGARRGVLSPVQFGPTSAPPRYLMMMSIHTTDLPAVFQGLLQGGGGPSPAIDRPRSYGFSYRAEGPKLCGKAEPSCQPG